MSPHISTLKLHQYRYGELDDAVATEVRAHLDTCERCTRRLTVQQRERDSFVLQPVPDAIAEVAAQPPPFWARWRRALVPMSLALAAAVALFVVVPTTERVDQGEDVILTKGALPELELWVGTADGPRALRPDEALRAGDTVQIVYHPKGAPFISLAGRDGTGAVEFYGSFQPAEEGLQPAPIALTLDAAPGPQAFFVIASDETLSENQVKKAVASDVKRGLRVTSLVVPKE